MIKNNFEDIPATVRIIMAFNKQEDEDGYQSIEHTYILRPFKLSFLQKILEINPRDPDPIIRDVILCYQLDKKRVAALKPYIIDCVIDFEKYDYTLSCYEKKAESESSLVCQ